MSVQCPRREGWFPLGYSQNGGLRRHGRDGFQVEVHTSHGGPETQTATRTRKRGTRSASEHQQSHREETRRDELASPQRHCLLASEPSRAVPRRERLLPPLLHSQTSGKSMSSAGPEAGMEGGGEGWYVKVQHTGWATPYLVRSIKYRHSLWAYSWYRQSGFLRMVCDFQHTPV